MQFAFSVVIKERNSFENSTFSSVPLSWKLHGSGTVQCMHNQWHGFSLRVAHRSIYSACFFVVCAFNLFQGFAYISCRGKTAKKTVEHILNWCAYLTEKPPFYKSHGAAKSSQTKIIKEKGSSINCAHDLLNSISNVIIWSFQGMRCHRKSIEFLRNVVRK